MEMTIKARRLDEDIHFEVSNPQGHVLHADGSTEAKGFRPMELLLSALGTCSAFDAVHILRKQRQEVSSFGFEVRGTRADEGAPRPFTAIHAHFTLSGNVEKEKAERAIALSMEKYCSVSATLRDEVVITHSFEIL